MGSVVKEHEDDGSDDDNDDERLGLCNAWAISEGKDWDDPVYE